MEFPVESSALTSVLSVQCRAGQAEGILPQSLFLVVLSVVFCSSFSAVSLTEKAILDLEGEGSL